MDVPSNDMDAFDPPAFRTDPGRAAQALCHTGENAPIAVFLRPAVAKNAPDAPQSLPALLRNGTVGTVFRPPQTGTVRVRNVPFKDFLR